MRAIRVVNASYFVAFTLTPEGNVGKARFLMRLTAPALRADL